MEEVLTDMEEAEILGHSSQLVQHGLESCELV